MLALFIISTLQRTKLLERIEIKNADKYKSSYMFDVTINKSNSENLEIPLITPKLISLVIPSEMCCPHLTLFER